VTGRIVAVEGGDGAGKRTISEALRDRLVADGLRAKVISFPRYQDTLGGRVIGEFLAHRVAAPADPRGVAIFYAADRFESKALIQELLDENDFLIADRYVASNVAYQAAKGAPEERQAIIDWIVDLEFGCFGLPRPVISVFLDMPVEVARQLVGKKDARPYTDRVLDRHEEDLDLQRRVAEAYGRLAADEVVSPWLVVSPLRNGTLRLPRDLADEIVSRLRMACEAQPGQMQGRADGLRKLA
jgi:dTMP kinase